MTDTIEEKIRLGNILLRLTDTAGIREADDFVEKLGVERNRGAKNARLVLAVFDGSRPLDNDDRTVIEVASRALSYCRR